MNNRIFLNAYDRIAQLNKTIDDCLTAAQAIRLAVAPATLALAESEAAHVSLAEAGINDLNVYTIEQQLQDMISNAKDRIAIVSGLIEGQCLKVVALGQQADRIATAEILKADKPNVAIPGLAYVDITWFTAELGCSVQHVRNLINRREIPAHDAVSDGENGRPKYLWQRHKAHSTLEYLIAKGAAENVFT